MYQKIKTRHIEVLDIIMGTKKDYLKVDENNLIKNNVPMVGFLIN